MSLWHVRSIQDYTNQQLPLRFRMSDLEVLAVSSFVEVIGLLPTTFGSGFQAFGVRQRGA